MIIVLKTAYVGVRPQRKQIRPNRLHAWGIQKPYWLALVADTCKS